MLRRLLVMALILGVGVLPTIGQEKKPDDKKPDTKKEDKKPDEKKGDEKVLLKWTFKANTPFYQKMVTKTEQSMKVQNQDVKQNQSQTFYFSWTPTKQTDDTWIIVQKIEGVAMDIDIGAQKISYDSTKKEAGSNPLAEFFNALKDSEFKITLKAKAGKPYEVTEVEGREEFLAKLVKANPQMKPLLEQILSKKALIEMAEPTFGAIPNKEVKKDDTWERKSTLDMGPIGKYDNSYTYKYVGMDNKLAKITVESTLKYSEPKAEGAGGGTGGLPFKIKNANLKSSKASGTILFNPDKGWIERSNMDLDLSGDLDIEIGGQTTKVTLTQTQKSSVETSDKTFLPAAKPEK